MEKLYEQWESDEEPIPNDELEIGDPNRLPPELDFSRIKDPDAPDALLKETKREQPVFLSIKGNIFMEPIEQRTRMKIL